MKGRSKGPAPLFIPLQHHFLYICYKDRVILFTKLMYDCHRKLGSRDSEKSTFGYFYFVFTNANPKNNFYCDVIQIYDNYTEVYKITLFQGKTYD